MSATSSEVLRSTSARGGVSGAAGRPQPIWYTLAIATLVVATTLYGLLQAGAYRVSDYQEAIWRAQDLVTLLTVPIAVWSGMRARKGSIRGHLVWLGLMLWLAYCYAHLAFGTPYNNVFLLYVAILGLAGYGLIDGLLRIDVVAVAPAFSRAPRRAASWFLIVSGLGIAALWLSEILAAFPDGQPASNLVYDMPSPTYVLDLAFVIPLALAGAWLLRREHPAGPIVTALTLVMLLVLSLAMLTLTPFAVAAKLHLDPEYVRAFIAFGSIFTLLTIVVAGLLVTGARRLQPVSRTWLRPTLWHAGSRSERR